MSVAACILDGPLSPGAAEAAAGAGAVVVFEGVVRELEDGRAISGLDYSAYRPMADRQLERLAGEVLSRFGLIAIRAEHSIGRVGVGEVSFRLTIRARHRKEALSAMDEFIDRLKQDVPIWKAAVFV